MKTLYLTRGNNILIDVENNTADRLSSARQAIDYIYKVTEPMHVVYQCGEVRKEADAENGDIIITFYDKVFDNQMIIVKNEDWFNNITNFEKREQEENLKWAAAKASEPCCESCEDCCKAN